MPLTMPDPADPDTVGTAPDGWSPPVAGQPARYESPVEGDRDYLKLHEELLVVHIVKSKGYGTSDDMLANYVGVAAITGDAQYVYPVSRIIEKCTRLQSLIGQGVTGEQLVEEFTDIAGLALCGGALVRRERAARQNALNDVGHRVGG